MSASQMSDSLTDGDIGAIGQAIGMMTPLSLGIRGSADEMITVIGRNSRFPCEQSVIIKPDPSTSSSLKIQILQGERARAEDNILIGELALNGQQVDEETVFKVTLRIDRNGHLFATARDLRADVWQELKIPNACAVPEGLIIRMIDAAKSDPHPETGSGSTINSLKSAVFLPAPTPESLCMHYDREEEDQQKERELESLIESLCSEYKQAMDDVIGKKKVLEDQELHDLHQTEMGNCLTRFENMSHITADLRLEDRINNLFEDFKSKNSEARVKSAAEVKSLTQQQLKLFEEQMSRTLSQMAVNDVKLVDNRYLTVKADMLRKFDSAIKSLDLNPGVTRKAKKDFDQDLESKIVSLVKERRAYLEAGEQKAQQILEEYQILIWKRFNGEPYMSPEQTAVAHQEIVSGIDFGLLDESCVIELKEKLNHELEAVYEMVEKLNTDREPRLQSLVDRLELRYTTNMTAIIACDKRRPPTLEKLKVEHEKVVASIFDLFMKDPDIIAVGRFRPEFEKSLVQRLDHRLKDIVSHFWQAIENHRRKLNDFAISSYVQSLEQEVEKQKPNTQTDLRVIHRKIMDQELSRYESDAVISESEHKDHHVLTLRQIIESTFGEKESKLMEEIKDRELQDKLDLVFLNFSFETRKQLTALKKVTEDDVTIYYVDSAENAVRLFLSLMDVDVSQDRVESYVSRLQQKMEEERKVLIREFKEKFWASRVRDLGSTVVGFVKGDNNGTCSAFSSNDTKQSQVSHKSFNDVVTKIAASPGLSSQPLVHIELQTPEELRDAAVQSFALEMGRYIDHHSMYADRLRVRDQISGRLLAELKDKGVPWSVLDSARQMMNKEWNKMKDRRSKGFAVARH